jgi:acetyltransferase-like isoleucine patch superfamily enzyme
LGAIGRFISYWKLSSVADSVRKILHFCLNLLFQPLILYRKVRFYFFTRCWIKNILGPIHISSIGNKISFGKNTTFYPYTLLEINSQSLLEVGDHFTLSYGSLIACNKSIKIGDYVMIGEYSSLRDSSHSYKEEGVPFTLQEDFQKEIIIGDNVWIGRGCIILPGSIIGSNVIIGANSVVKGIVESNGIYAGSPLILLKNI